MTTPPAVYGQLGMALAFAFSAKLGLLPAADAKLKAAIFSKHLLFLQGAALAPAAAKPFATPAPIPFDAPVTTATLFANFFIF